MPKHCSGPFVAAPIVTEPEEAAVDLATAQSAGRLTKAVVTDLFSAHDFESFTFGEDATFDDDAQNAFCTAIGRCMTVSALSLRNVTPATARFDVPAFITAAVVENLSIQRLDLTNSGLTATDAKMIADLVLPWNRTVVEWDFSGNPLEDAGVTALVTAMESGSSSIQRLSFRACGVTTPDAISSAIRAFDKMPCLYQVDISGNAGLTAKAQPLLEDLDRTLERNLRLLHPGDDIAAKSLWTPELEAALNQQESEQNTPAASPGGAANPNQSSTMDRRRSFHNNGGGPTSGASGSAAASNAGSFQGRPRSATLGASPRSRQRGQSMRQGGAPPPYLPRKSSPASRGPGTAASPARAASSGNDANNNNGREETANQGHGVDRASRHKAIPAGGTLEGVSHTESESETPGTAASRSESTGDAAPANSEPSAKKPTTKKAKAPPRKAPSPAPQQQRRASPTPGPRRAPSPANTPRRGQSPAGSMNGSAGGRRWAPSGRPESPMRQDDIAEGVEEWRRRRNEYNGFIRSPGAGPKLSAEEEAKQHRARVQKLEPKFAFGQRLDRVRQSTSAVFRPKVTPEVREPTPRERRLLAPWNQPNNGRAQSPAGGGGDAAFHDPNDMQHSHTFGLREMDKQVTTVGQVHKVSADALSSRTGTPNGRSRSPAAGSRGQPMIRLVDGGVTSYVADDPRDIGHIARKHESGNARADGKLFASNTPREVRWGVDSKASSYVSTKAQAPGPGFYTVPDEWDARARKLREKARNTSGTNRPMFGASAAPRSGMSSKVEKDMSRPGPGEYEIP